MLYVGVFATPSEDNENRFNMQLLAVSSMKNKTAHDASEHLDFLEFVLDFFRKDKNILIVFIQDSTNQTWVKCV